MRYGRQLALTLGAALFLGAGNTHVTAQESVTLITDFGFNGRHAYFFVALDKGHYKAAGLDVRIVRGQGSVDAIRQVGAGNAVFGFADTGSLVLARANDGIPVKLTAIVYAKPPQAIFCRADAGLKVPKDLEGRSIANPAGGSIPDMFPAYAKAAGIDATKVRWVVASSDSLPGLLATNRVPCIGQFTVGEPLLRGHLGAIQLVRFAYSDPGLNYYGNGIVATDATIATKPDLVRRFVNATVKGMKEAFANPAEAGAIMNKYHPQIDRTIAQGETEAVAELAQVAGQPLGVIDPARIEATLSVVYGAFNPKTRLTATDVYASGFVTP
ncbi:MAG TPA: ABC transporter substrate-binding protein [Xanthobacteraceae bacterium]|nr:ABC transporter substrate-binding protein [Xanthobacteraceae bacterium]